MTTLSADQRDEFFLAGRDVLTVNASAGVGILKRYAEAAGGALQSQTSLDGETITVGPFAIVQRFTLECQSGSISWSAAPAELLATDPDLKRVTKLTQAAYDALSPPNDDTLYVIVG